MINQQEESLQHTLGSNTIYVYVHVHVHKHIQFNLSVMLFLSINWHLGTAVDCMGETNKGI